MTPISQAGQGIGSQPMTAAPIALLSDIIVDPSTMTTLPGYIMGILPYWLNLVNKEVERLNQIISAYNAETDAQIKQMYFGQLIAQNQLIKDVLPGYIISSLPDFQNKFYKQLAPAIAEHAKQFQPTNTPLTLSVPSFNDVLNGMSQVKLSRLMEILSHGAHTTDIELDSLYDVMDMSTEAQQFRNFRQSYSLTFIGGSNAQNFKLTRLDTNEESVLKVEYRMDSPKVVERRLRGTSIRDHFPSIYAERQATFKHAVHGQTTCCLIQTDLAQGGDLEAYAKKFAGHPLPRLLAASDLFGQMSNIFISMQQQNAAFPDAKNTNWLVDKRGKLILADTKSYIPTRPDGTFVRNENMLYYGFGCIRTPYVSPPEIMTQNMTLPIDADAMHAYMLGKNLYQFVTNCEWDIIEDKKNFDFTLPVFQTPEGMLIAQIIQNTILDDPQHRMRLSAAQSQLKTIQDMLSAKKEANMTLTRMGALDPQNTAYFENLRIRLNNSGNLAEVQVNQYEVQLQFESLHKKLAAECETLKNDLITELQKIAPEFKQDIQQWELEIQQALSSPESLHLISQQIAHQKAMIQAIKAEVRQAGYHQTQPRAIQEQIRGLIKQTIITVLHERDLSKLQGAKDSIGLKIRKHIQKEIIKPNAINSSISYKKELGKITNATAEKSAKKTAEDGEESTYNPMHRS